MRSARQSSLVVTIPPSPVVSILLPKKLNVADVADRADRTPTHPRAVSLRRILDHEQSVPASDSSDRIHVAGMPTEVHRDDSACLAA